jgi:hypothetical protein
MNTIMQDVITPMREGEDPSRPSKIVKAPNATPSNAWNSTPQRDLDRAPALIVSARTKSAAARSGVTASGFMVAV